MIICYDLFFRSVSYCNYVLRFLRGLQTSFHLEDLKENYNTEVSVLPCKEEVVHDKIMIAQQVEKYRKILSMRWSCCCGSMLRHEYGTHAFEHLPWGRKRNLEHLDHCIVATKWRAPTKQSNRFSLIMGFNPMMEIATSWKLHTTQKEREIYQSW